MFTQRMQFENVPGLAKKMRTALGKEGIVTEEPDLRDPRCVVLVMTIFAVESRADWDTRMPALLREADAWDLATGGRW
jgi:hypothetical protein